MPEYLEEASKCSFVLANGNCSYPNQICVIIEGKGLEEPSLVKAVDICFNSFLHFDH